jgi:integrase
MEAYLRDCRKLARRDEFLFVSMGGGAVPYVTARATFLAVVRKLGIRGAPGDRGPCLHGLRHAFVIRSLENCPRDRVASHMLALSTYLGHAHIADTYWYLQMTPQLTTGIADACQGYLRGETL